MQETFFAALRNASQFDRNRSILSWFFGIAHKKAIDYFRHVKVEVEHQREAGRSVGRNVPGTNMWRLLSNSRSVTH